MAEAAGVKKPPPAQTVTELLNAVAEGQPGARDRLFASVYSEFRLAARACLRGQRASVQPTELANEMYLKLAGSDAMSKGRAYFFAAAAWALFEINCKRTRSKKALRRGGAWKRTNLADVSDIQTFEAAFGYSPALRIAMARLETEDSDQADVIQYRFVLGLSLREVADLTGRSSATIHKRQRAALMRLRELLEHSEHSNEP